MALDKQQIFTFWSKTWVCDYDVKVAFTNPDDVPEGTRIVNMSNQDITSITTESTGDGYAGKFKVLYPLESVQGNTGSVQLSFSTNVYKYAVFFAVCQEKDQYGNLQNYVVDTDPTTSMKLSAYSNYEDSEIDTPDTGLRILKYETGTEIPISGALFEVIGPDGDSIGTFATNGDGRIEIPLSKVGNYTVIERQAPSHYIISEEPAQNVTVVYDEVAEVTFFNDPYGTLRIEKKSDTGMNLPGAVIKIEHIESGQTWTATTTSAGVAIFDEIPLGAYRIQEITAPAGWKLDDTVYTATVVAGETTTIPIINEELPGLRIIKYDRKNMVAMPNVTFAVYRDGEFLGNFKTDQFGEILLTNVEPGTYRAFEVDTGDEGHILDTTPQEVELHAGDGIKELLFFNDVKPGLRLVKVDSDDPSKVIPNAVFEIKSVEGTYGPQEFWTDENGEIDLSMLPPGSYVVTEKSCDGYVIDEAQRIYGVKFLLYDEDRNPIGEFTSDDNGYVYITSDDLPDGANTSGRFYLRELEAAEGYILDEEYKTVYVRPGRTAEIEWVNEAITGQIQIYKYASEANPVTGDPAGTPLQGAVYEIIHERSGRVVDYITTNARGVAASKPLPLMRYKIREVTAPAYYQLDPTVHDVTLEYAGQIIKIAAYDKPANLKVTVTKTGNKQLLAGDSMRYDLTVANNSNVALENFYLHDQFPTDCSTAKTITTGTYNTRLNYQITYKTNYNDYRVLATNLLSTNNYAFDLSAVQLMQGEVVTDVRLEFGKVPAGFASVVKPTVTVQTSASLANGYQVVNRVDAGGQYMSQWETGRAAWITLIVRLNEPTLPKTGY